jgi:hypothetical protein
LDSATGNVCGALTDADISRLKPAEVVMMLKTTFEIERKARERFPAEQEKDVEGCSPNLQYQLYPGMPFRFPRPMGRPRTIPSRSVDDFSPRALR